MSAGARKQKKAQDKVPLAPSAVEAKDVGDDEESESSTVQSAMALLKGAVGEQAGPSISSARSLKRPGRRRRHRMMEKVKGL